MSYQYNPYQGQSSNGPGMEKSTLQLAIMILITCLAVITSVWVWHKPYGPITERLQQWLGPLYVYHMSSSTVIPAEGLALTAAGVAIIVGVPLLMVAQKKSLVPMFLGALLGAAFSNMIYMAILVIPILGKL
jgi:hypothetical protein